MLPPEISVGNKCPNCKYQRCFISCCQKFLRATKITFSRSLILEDCFCTLGRFQNLTNRSVPHLQSFVNSDKKEPKSKIYTKNAFSQNYRHRERKQRSEFSSFDSIQACNITFVNYNFQNSWFCNFCCLQKILTFLLVSIKK